LSFTIKLILEAREFLDLQRFMMIKLLPKSFSELASFSAHTRVQVRSEYRVGERGQLVQSVPWSVLRAPNMTIFIFPFVSNIWRDPVV